jgi:hypothetical protein
VGLLKFVTVVACGLALACSSICTAQNEDTGSNQQGIFGRAQPGEVSVVRMEAKRLGLKNFQMQSRSSNGRLAIDGFTANLGSGTMQGQGLVDWSKPNDRQYMTIQISNVEAAALMKAFEIKVNAQVNAMVSGTIQAQWQGVRGSTPRETMNGTIAMQFGPGVVTNADALNMIANATGIAELQRFDFSSAQIQATMANGLVSFTQLVFAGPTQQAIGNGNLDLRTEELKVKWDAYVSPEVASRSSQSAVRAASGLVSKARGSNGLVKIPIPIAMVGSVRDPEFVIAAPEQRAAATKPQDTNSRPATAKSHK